MSKIDSNSSPWLNDETRLRKAWFAVWLVGSLVWIAVFINLLLIPTDPKNQLLGGYSSSRLILLISVAVLGLLNLAIAWFSIKRPLWRKKYLDPILTNTKLFRLILFFLLAIGVGLWAGALITDGFTRPGRIFKFYSAYIERLNPFLLGIIVECGILIIGLLILRYGLHLGELRKEKSLWALAALITGFLGCVIMIMGVTGIGITPDVYGWGKPGVPVLFYQVVFAWLAGLSLFLLLLLPKKIFKVWQRLLLDSLICLFLWWCAVSAWSDLDVQRSYFAPSPLPPNEEVYPYSDAAFYDYNAQSLLLGYGFAGGQVVPRPLYILLLAGFHAIAGQGYEQTIYIQTLFLALLPVSLYLLGKAIHSRGLGLSLGVISVLRESNSILATPWVEVSHSKLFMADLPTMLVVVVLTWVTVRWFSQPQKNWGDALIVGGTLGITTLFRTQTILFLPAILAMMIWYYRKKWGMLAKTSLLLFIGLLLVFSPWLIRNYHNTGALVFDDPATQNALVAQRYSTEMGGMPTRQPGESNSEYAKRLSKIIRQFIQENPDIVAGFVTAHSLNNLVSTALVLPMRFSWNERCDTIDLCSPFWISLIDNFAFSDSILLLINLFVVSFGIASSWRRWKVAGLVPLIFLSIYSLSNALARNSARRYILPVDWISYLYLFIGLFEIVLWAAILLGANIKKLTTPLTLPSADDPKNNSRIDGFKISGFGVVFLLIGLSLPLVEAVRPASVNIENEVALASELPKLLSQTSSSKLPISIQSIETFLSLPGARIIQGREFYPRYYIPLEGEPGSGWPAYQPYEYRETGKIGFILVGPQGLTQANLALDDPPGYFPNARDVVVIGCNENNYIDALLVIFLDGSNQVLSRSKTNNLTCPMK